DFVCPSLTRYPFQWFWDSAFHAIALVQVDPALAKQEIRCLMQGAQPDGFIPHMLLWEKSAHEAALREYSIALADPFFTAIIQPDESGLDASPKYDELMEISASPPEEVLPQLRRSMQRLFTAYAPYRSEPARIAVLDVFTWEDVMFNAIYGDGLRCLAKLC